MATILIVDDLAANRQLLVTLLSHQGHRLLEASDGSDGLAAVRIERPDLVITDVLMPVMDGYEFVRQLRLDPETSEIPVVFYTAHYGEREARALALSSGVSDVLTKPAESAEVLRVVARVLARESESGVPSDAAPLTPAFDREHLRLITDKLSEKAGDLRTANARLRALINIGLELASERDPDRLLQSVCLSARDLFGAYLRHAGHPRPERPDSAALHDLRSRTPPLDRDRRPGPGHPPDGRRRATHAARRQSWRRSGHAAVPGAPSGRAVISGCAGRIAGPCLWLDLFRGQRWPDLHRGRRTPGHGVFGTDWPPLRGRCTRSSSASRPRSALRDERDRAQRYLDTAEVILLALDLDGCITLINRKGCDLLGWTEPELLGRDFLETCLPARTREALSQEVSRRDRRRSFDRRERRC